MADMYEVGLSVDATGVKSGMDQARSSISQTAQSIAETQKAADAMGASMSRAAGTAASTMRAAFQPISVLPSQMEAARRAVENQIDAMHDKMMSRLISIKQSLLNGMVSNADAQRLGQQAADEFANGFQRAIKVQSRFTGYGTRGASEWVENLRQMMPQGNALDLVTGDLVKAPEVIGKITKASGAAGLGLGRLRYSLISLAAQATGTIPILDRLGFVMLQFIGDLTLKEILLVVAAVTAVAGVFRLLTEDIRKAKEAMQQFEQSSVGQKEAYAATLPFHQLGSYVQVEGPTKQYQEARDAADAYRKELVKLMQTQEVVQGGGQGGPVSTAGYKLNQLNMQVADFVKELYHGQVNIDQFHRKLFDLALANPGFEQMASNAEKIGREWYAARTELAAYDQAQANLAYSRRMYGNTGKIGESLDQANQRLFAFQKGGFSGLKQFEEQQKAVADASKEWDNYIATNHLAAESFQDALARGDQQAKQYAEGAKQAAAAVDHLAASEKAYVEWVKNNVTSQENAASATGNPFLMARAKYRGGISNRIASETQGMNPGDTATMSSEITRGAELQRVGQLNDAYSKSVDAQNAMAYSALKEIIASKGMADAMGLVNAQLDYMRDVAHINATETGEQASRDLAAARTKRDLALAVQRSRLETEADNRAKAINNQLMADNLRSMGYVAPGVIAPVVHEVAAGVKKDLDTLKTEQEQASKIAMQPWLNMGRELQTTFGSFFESIFSGGVNSFQKLADSVKGIFAKLLAQIVAMKVAQRVLSPAMASAMGIPAMMATNGFNTATFDYNNPDANSPFNLASGGGSFLGMKAGALTGLSGVAAAGAGFSMGYGMASSYGTTAGAIGGTLSGAATGFMVAGPIGAAIGGLAGLTGALIGGAKAASERAKAEKILQTAMEASMASLEAQVLGGPYKLTAQQASLKDQILKMTQDINKAYPGKKNEADRNAQLAELNQLEQTRLSQLSQEYALEQKTMTQSLQARLLRAQGNTVAADMLDLQVKQEEEMQKAQEEGWTQSQIDLLKLVQAREKERALINETASALENAVQGYKLNLMLYRYSPSISPGYLPGMPVPTTPATAPTGASGDMVSGNTPVIIKLDGQVIAKSTVKNLQAMAQRQFGTSSKWGDVTVN